MTRPIAFGLNQFTSIPASLINGTTLKVIRAPTSPLISCLRGATVLAPLEDAMPEPKNLNLDTFIAGAALERGEPFPLTCNCGTVVTIMPPFQDDYVVCPSCEVTIKMLVVDGDPGYIIGADPDGTPKLLPVQGSSAKHPNQMSKAECEKILSEVRSKVPVEE